MKRTILITMLTVGMMAMLPMAGYAEDSIEVMEELVSLFYPNDSVN